MSDTDTPPCVCCAGTSRETPAPIWNRPRLSQIAYRVGTPYQLQGQPAGRAVRSELHRHAPLTTRDDSDFSIALLDAFAVSADILTFYQERLANESYLRTAVQQRSVFELARLVGYQPSPGVAASAPLAFTLNDAPGAPDPVTIDAGTRVQSVPAPGQQPATFETAAQLIARIAHNAHPCDRDASGGLDDGQHLAVADRDRDRAEAGRCDPVRRRRAGVSQHTDERDMGAPHRHRRQPRLRRAAARESTGTRRCSPSSSKARRACSSMRCAKRASLFGVNAPDIHILPKNIGFPTKAPTTGISSTSLSTSIWTRCTRTSHLATRSTRTSPARRISSPGSFCHAPGRSTRFASCILSQPPPITRRCFTRYPARPPD